MTASRSFAGKPEPGSFGSDPHGLIQTRSLAGKINHRFMVNERPSAASLPLARLNI
jgi:hypothetical protein